MKTMPLLRQRFLIAALAAGFLGAFSPTRAQAPATPGPERYLPSLRVIKANNEAILKRQKEMLRRIDAAAKTADTIRILSRRG